MTLCPARQGTKRTLILREIPEDGATKFLSNQDCLAACDVAVFVYDRYGVPSFAPNFFMSLECKIM